jgi:hypothetical protein
VSEARGALLLLMMLCCALGAYRSFTVVVKASRSRSGVEERSGVRAGVSFWLTNPSSARRQAAGTRRSAGERNRLLAARRKSSPKHHIFPPLRPFPAPPPLERPRDHSASPRPTWDLGVVIVAVALYRLLSVPKRPRTQLPKERTTRDGRHTLTPPSPQHHGLARAAAPDRARAAPHPAAVAAAVVGRAPPPYPGGPLPSSPASRLQRQRRQRAFPPAPSRRRAHRPPPPALRLGFCSPRAFGGRFSAPQP